MISTVAPSKPSLRRGLLKREWIPLALLVPLVIALRFDLWQCQSKYQYFTTLVGFALFAVALILGAFKGKKWSDPPEKGDLRAQPSWQKHAAFLSGYFIVMGVVTLLVWILGIPEFRGDFGLWFRSGAWYLFFVVIFGINVFLIRRHLQHIHLHALALTCLILTVILSAYEAILLFQNMGWKYNHTVMGWVLGVPVENILFSYPLAPAFCIILYSIFSVNRNQLQAFVLMVSILFPAAILVEILGIYGLNLWHVFNDQSVWPMGRTNFEEFFYWFLFQVISLAMYEYFNRNLKRPN